MMDDQNSDTAMAEDASKVPVADVQVGSSIRKQYVHTGPPPVANKGPVAQTEPPPAANAATAGSD